MSFPSLPETIEWIRERRANCLGIAREKTGADRDGWIEDARYFEATETYLRTAAQLTKSHEGKK